ncbi:MAG: zinc ribbon domain-containing protein [Actinobacteria bacterium]|nr:zinc ribbon domain-containing protein [Actinomycetota bacterium]
MRLPGSKPKPSANGARKSPPPPGAPPPAARPASLPGAAPPAGGTVRAGGPPPGRSLNSAYGEEFVIDLKRRREQLVARVAELQWDLGGLTYEMAIRNSIRVEVLVKRAAELQDADAELNEVERILRMEESATAGSCPSCGAPHSSGATFCWQCGKPLLEQVSGDTILRR